MKRSLLTLALLVWLCQNAWAVQTSNVDPTYPSTNDDIDAEPLRLQFQAIHDDENALFGLIGTGTAGSCGITGQLCWYNGSGLAGLTMTGDCTLVAATGAISCHSVGGLNPFNAANLLGTVPSASVPTPTPTTLGGVQSAAPVAHEFVTAVSTSGVLIQAQPNFLDLTGAASPSQIPYPTISGIGGVQASSAIAHQFVTGVSTSGVMIKAQPDFSDLTGSIAASQLAGNPVSGASAEYPLDDGAGTIIRDISGNGQTGTFCTNNPTWTTYGLSFNNTGLLGITNYCVSTPVKSWKTVLVHVCGSPLTRTSGISGISAPYAQAPVIIGTSDALQVASGHSTSDAYRGAINPAVYYVSGGSFQTTTSTNIGPCNVLAVTLDTSDHIYVDGVEQSYASQSASASHVATTGAGYVIGSAGQSAVTPNAFAGTIDYVLFYSTVLTLTQVGQVSRYVTSIVSSRPGFPTYPTFSTAKANQLICAGDSITAGANGTAEWCNTSNITTANTYTMTNYGFAWDQAHNAVALAPARFYSAVSPQAGRNICHIWYGTNDVTNGNYTAADTWGVLQQIGLKAKAAGCTPVIATMISRSGADTLKNQLNALIRANWRQAFAALDDIAAIPGLGADGAYNNPSVPCFSPGTPHPAGPGAGTCYNSLSGYGIVAKRVGNVVDILDGSTADNPTVVSANSYLQAYADNVVLQTPTASATDTLPDCTGLTSMKRTIFNGSGSFTITVNTSASQTITGSASIAPNSTGAFVCQLTSASSGGNYWLREQ